MMETIINTFIGFLIVLLLISSIDIISNLMHSKQWTKTKNEIIEYLKTLGNSEVIGHSNDVWEAQIIMTTYEIQKNIGTLFAYSLTAKRLHKVFD